jgi:cyclophilin family peptidyl-prolyl cis-trans isomerase
MTDRRQRQKEMRAARREAERRRASRRELRRRVLIALGIGLGLAAAFLVLGTFGNRPPTLPAAFLMFRDQATACGAEAPPQPEPATAFAQPEDQGLAAGATAVATITTSCGDITVELDQAGFPLTANSFVFLARHDFYDGLVFHRILPGFVAQGGDPNGDGTGGPGYAIADEFPPADFAYEPGVVAMANRGSGTTGSQFFVVLGTDARALGNTFSVLGRVTAGEETLQRIAGVPTAVQSGSAERSRPLETVYIEDVVIDVSP